MKRNSSEANNNLSDTITSFDSDQSDVSFDFNRSFPSVLKNNALVGKKEPEDNEKPESCSEQNFSFTKISKSPNLPFQKYIPTEFVTVLFKQKSDAVSGDFLGRLVLGVEGDKIKVFGATIF